MAGIQGKEPRVQAGRLSALLLLVAISVAGCAEVQSIFGPSPATVPPVKRETPPPVLSPQVGRKDEDRLKQEANGKIQRAEHTVQQVDQRKLAKDQQETYATIRSFIASAREALSARDMPKANNLAEKAQVLADDLLRTLR
jgi:hypothetical protein